MLFLLRWLSRRSLRSLHALGAFLGWMVYVLSPTYRRRLATMWPCAGMPCPAARPAMAEAGRLVMELPFLWLRPASVPLGPRPAWQGEALVGGARHKAAAWCC